MQQGREEKEVDPETHDGLRKIRAIYSDIYGVPLNFADNLSSELRYQDINEENPIVQAVLNTGMHRFDNPNVRFALAIHCFPYHNNIASTWVYVAVVTSRS